MAPPPSSRSQDQQKKKRRDSISKEILSLFWLIFLLASCILQWWGYFISNRWFLNKDDKNVHVGLLQHYRKHDAWLVAVILLGISLGAVTISAVCSFVFYCVRLKRAARLRHFCLRVCKLFCTLSGLCMLVGLIVFPFGFESRKILPCKYTATKEKAFFLCNPWRPDLALYAMIIAQVFLTLAICLSACIISKIQEDQDQKRKKQNDDTDWTQKYGTAPLLSDASSRTSSTGMKHGQGFNEVMVLNARHDMESLHKPGYFDIEQPGQSVKMQETRFEDAYLDFDENQESVENTVLNDEDTGYLEFDPNGVLTSMNPQSESNYLDFDEPILVDGTFQQDATDAAYLQFDLEDNVGEQNVLLPKTHPLIQSNEVYLDFDENVDGQPQLHTTAVAIPNNATDAYMDFDQDDGDDVSPANDMAHEATDAYIDFDQEDGDDISPANDMAHEATDAYMDFDQDDGDDISPANDMAHEATDAYIDFDQEDENTTSKDDESSKLLGKCSSHSFLDQMLQEASNYQDMDADVLDIGTLDEDDEDILDFDAM